MQIYFGCKENYDYCVSIVLKTLRKSLPGALLPSHFFSKTAAEQARNNEFLVQKAR